jgi:hypothetical protein
VVVIKTFRSPPLQNLLYFLETLPFRLRHEEHSEDPGREAEPSEQPKGLPLANIFVQIVEELRHDERSSPTSARHQRRCVRLNTDRKQLRRNCPRQGSYPKVVHHEEHDQTQQRQPRDTSDVDVCGAAQIEEHAEGHERQEHPHQRDQHQQPPAQSIGEKRSCEAGQEHDESCDYRRHFRRHFVSAGCQEDLFGVKQYRVDAGELLGHDQDQGYDETLHVDS